MHVNYFCSINCVMHVGWTRRLMCNDFMCNEPVYLLMISSWLSIVIVIDNWLGYHAGTTYKWLFQIPSVTWIINSWFLYRTCILTIWVFHERTLYVHFWSCGGMFLALVKSKLWSEICFILKRFVYVLTCITVLQLLVTLIINILEMIIDSTNTRCSRLK